MKVRVFIVVAVVLMVMAVSSYCWASMYYQDRRDGGVIPETNDNNVRTAEDIVEDTLNGVINELGKVVQTQDNETEQDNTGGMIFVGEPVIGGLELSQTDESPVLFLSGCSDNEKAKISEPMFVTEKTGIPDEPIILDMGNLQAVQLFNKNIVKNPGGTYTKYDSIPIKALYIGAEPPKSDFIWDNLKGEYQNPVIKIINGKEGLLKQDVTIVGIKLNSQHKIEITFRDDGTIKVKETEVIAKQKILSSGSYSTKTYYKVVAIWEYNRKGEKRRYHHKPEEEVEQYTWLELFSD